MTKWEYRQYVDWLSHRRLDGIGAEGWELVSYVRMASAFGGDKHHYIFKRPKP